MKKLDELGISPTPWKMEYSNDIDRVVNITDANDKTIVETDCGFYPPELPDARVMTAAPKLYQALWLQCFGDTGIGNCRNCKGSELGNCKTCSLGEARSALAEAAGESEVRHE